MPNNSFITCQEIARAALPMLSDCLVFPTLAYTDYSSDFHAKGDTIQVRKPAKFVAKEFSGAIDAQDVSEGSVLVKLDKIADVSTVLTAREMAMNVENFTQQIVKPAIMAIAEKINSDGFQLYKDIPYVCGTAGTTPHDLSDFTAAAKALNDNKAPTAGRAAVWDTEAMAKLQLIPAVVNAEKSGSNAALREGCLGRVTGLDNYMSQAVARHTTGGSGTILIDNAGGYQAGVTQLHLDGLTTACVKGDVLGIGGDTYTVVDAGELASADQDVTVYPGLRKAVSDNAAVSITASHTANLAFHRNAFAFVNRPLEVAHGVESYVTSYNGISLRVTLGYDMSSKQQTLSIDTLYGYKTLYPELAVRVLG